MKTLRLWPGTVAAVLIFIGLVLLPLISRNLAVFGWMGAMLGAVVVAVWWLFFSRAPWLDRVGALALIAVAFAATRPFMDPSILNGAMGFLSLLAIPVPAFALVAWAVMTRGQSSAPRRWASLVASVVIACAFCTTVRTAGMIGGGGAELHWRWTPTPEERLLAQGSDEPTPIPAAASSAGSDALALTTPAAPATPAMTAPTPRKPADWPGFRGPARDGVVRNARIATDWTTTPPVQVWHRPIGPGWSSFAVDRGLIYTQEQRGGDEIVACYRLSTGEPVWRHRDPVRFWESNGGAGPRGTPTLVDGRVYALGATGVLNVLDADTGAVIWSRNAAADAKIKVPMWGFASSPLVAGDVVIVATSGKLVGYDLVSGAPRWFGPAHRGSYSSPQRATIGGVDQIVMLTADGATSVAPSTGAVLWEHAWEAAGTPIVQPAFTADGDVLVNSISAMGGVGVRRLSVTHDAGGWRATERWTSSGLKPYFNDFVVLDGYAYGFDGTILSCIDLADGKRVWKGGRYGAGQLIALPDQHVLLVVSEEGELALVSATPDQFKEIAHVPAIDGKTWNHPVLVGDMLLVRNGEEMAAFRVTLVR